MDHKKWDDDDNSDRHTLHMQHTVAHKPPESHPCDPPLARAGWTTLRHCCLSVTLVNVLITKRLRRENGQGTKSRSTNSLGAYGHDKRSHGTCSRSKPEGNQQR